jgi:sugar phosphate permease
MGIATDSVLHVLPATWVGNILTFLHRVLDWRPPTPFYYGWLILFTGALGTFVATTLAGVVFGGIQGLIAEEMNWSRSSIGITAAAGVWGSGLLAPFIGRVADRHGPRWLMPVGTVILGVCLYALGGVSTIWQFFLFAVIGRAISQPLLIGLVPRTVAVNFFDRRRNLALAFTGLFRPFTSAINIQIISNVAVARGWRTSFRYLGVASLILTIPLMIVVRSRPEDIGLSPDGAAPVDSSTRENVDSSSRPPGTSGTSSQPATTQRDWSASEVMKTRTFWLIALTSLVSVTAGSGIGFNMVPYFHESANLSTLQGAGVLSVSTFLSLASLGWGALADKITPRRCIIIAMIGATAAATFLLTVSNLATAYAFGVVWGLVSAGSDILIYMLLAQYFGRSSYGTISGILRPFEAGGLGLGMTLGGLSFDLTKTYKWLILGSIAAHGVAAVLVFLAKPPTAPSRASL